MFDRLRIFLALLALVFVAGTSTFNNNIDMRTGLVIPPPGQAPAPPVVTANQTRTLTTGNPPVNNGDNIGAALTASGTPTDWAITSCPGCAGYFDFLPNGAQHTSQLRVANAAALNAITTSTNYQPIVQASNTGGQGSATVTITATPGAVVGTKPVISTVVTTFSPSTPATNGFQFATLTATNVPQQWVITNVSGALGTDFQIVTDTNVAHDGKLVWGSTGATGFDGSSLKKTASLTIRADNAGGQSTTVVFTVNAYADGSIESCVDAAPNPPPVVQASTFNVFDPVANGTTVGDVIATNPPNTYSVLSCLNCTGFFNFPTATSPTMKVTTAGATALNALTVQTTYHPVVQASNGNGNGSNTMNVVVTPASAFDDGHLGASVCSGGPNDPNFFTNLGYVARPPWQVAGVDYCVGAPTVPPSGIPYKDPATIPICPNGTQVAATGHICRNEPAPGQRFVYISGNGAVLDGYDFGTAPGGYWLHLANTGIVSNVTITNNKFTVVPSNPLPIFNLNDNQLEGTNLISHNTFNFNSTPTDPALIYFVTGNRGTVEFSYNVMLNSWSDWITYGGGSPDAGINPPNGGSMTFKYNYFLNAGIGGASVHGDWFAPQSASFDLLSFTFNVFSQQRQNVATHGIGTGCGNNADNGATHLYFGNTIFSNNVAGPSWTLESTINRMDNQAMTARDNYIDLTGAGSNSFVLNLGTAGLCTGTLTHSGNINMKTGGPANPN